MTTHATVAPIDGADEARPLHLIDKLGRSLANVADAISARLWALEYSRHERDWMQGQDKE